MKRTLTLLAAVTVALSVAPATAHAALYHCTPAPGDRSFADGVVGSTDPAAPLPMCVRHVQDSVGEGDRPRLPGPRHGRSLTPSPDPQPELRALIVLEGGIWRGTGGVTR